MKKIYLASLLVLALGAGLTQAQTLTFLDSIQFPAVNNQFGAVGTSDCWGWTDGNGVDYAIVGNSDHVAFVRASDGAVLDQIPAPANQDAYYHRDMVTHGNYAYCVAEMRGVNEGLMIFDLSPLPDSVRFVGSWTNNGSLIRSHNLDIDAGTSHLYIEADESQGNFGVEIVDISNPEMPVHAGFMNIPNTHDIHARNDTLWVAEGWTPNYSVWDVSNKTSPSLIASVGMPTFGYCHNIWPSDDGKYFITTEETSFKTVKIWELVGPGNIVPRGNYLGANDLAHNVQVMGDYVFISHYTAGVTVIDWTDKDNPVEVAAYDTYPQNDIDDFFGCWGAFPYTANGYVYASNFEGTLFILSWDPSGVAIEEGHITEEDPAWPNPFRSVTNIPFTLDAATDVFVGVYDMQGTLVTTLQSGELAAGRYVLPWRPDASIASGMYFVKLEAGAASGTRKVQLLR